MNIILGLSVAVMAFFGWCLFCNFLTHRQRTKIIDFVFADVATYRHLQREYSRVSYEAHLWALVTFRDPMRLYPTHFRTGVQA